MVTHSFVFGCFLSSLQADGTSVVARSLVLLECALFVNKLLSGAQTVWLQHNRDGGHYVCIHLRRWGEAIGEKLRLIELKEREMMKRLRKRGEDSEVIVLPEEPVFPDSNPQRNEEDEAEKEQTVSYAVKMAACVLLLEITRFINDPPSQYSLPPLSQVTTPRFGYSSTERKQSAASNYSSEAESAKPWNTLYPGDARPTLVHQHTGNLSFDDSESQEGMGRHISFDDGGGGGGGGALLSPSPRKKRVSVYLSVSMGAGGSGTSTSRLGRKQTIAFKDVHIVGGTPGELRQPSTPGGSPSPRLRKQSLFTSQTATALHRPSVNARGPRRPSLTGVTPKPSSAGIHRRSQAIYRRKSTGTHLSTQSREAPTQTPIEATSRPTLQTQTSTTSTRGVGGALNEGFTKLRRSAQRAFRRQLGRKKPDAFTPVGSPNLPQRKKMQRRMSVTGSLSQLTMEDRRKEYSWLDVVEHMVLVDSLDPDARKRHRRVCADLITAIGLVYSSESLGAQETERQEGVDGRVRKSLSTLLAGVIAPNPTSVTHLRQNSLPVAVHATLSTRHPGTKTPAGTQRATSVPFATRISTVSPRAPSAPNPLALMNFGHLNYERFTSSFLLVTSSGEEGSIERFLEEETATPKSILAARADEVRRDYLQDSYAGLLHAPFALLVHAAPILHGSTFAVLKTVAWATLLDSDHKLAQAAGTVL